MCWVLYLVQFCGLRTSQRLSGGGGEGLFVVARCVSYGVDSQEICQLRGGGVKGEGGREAKSAPVFGHSLDACHAIEVVRYTTFWRKGFPE